MTETADQLLQGFQERFECWNCGDLDEMQAMYHADAVYDPTPFAVDEREYVGHEDMRRQWEQVWEVWGGLRMDPIEAIEVAPNRYVVVVRLWGRGRQSGAEVDQELAFVYTLRDGLVARAEVYPRKDDAMAAAAAQRQERTAR